MRKMNLLFVQDYCLFVTNGIGFQLSRCLAQRGHNVHFMGCTPTEPPATLAGFERIHLHTPRISPANMSKFSGALKVASHNLLKGERLLRCEKIDVVVFYQILSGLPLEFLCELRGIPTISYFLSPWHREYELETPGSSLRHYLNVEERRLAQRLLLKRCDRIFCASRFMRDEVQKLVQRKPDIIPHGVDIETFRPAPDKKVLRRKLNLPENSPVVLTVRRLVRRMGLKNFLRAARQIRNVFPDTFFVIGGSGPLQNELVEFARHLGLADKTRFEGFIPPDLLPDYYAAADVFVLPTAALEGFGIVILEAMASGTPVVATPVAAIPELLNQVAPELLSEARSAEAISEKIEMLLSDEMDGKEIGRRCRQFVEKKYAWDKIAPRVEERLREVAGI
ncbi:MAG: glycosyltransferase family 4 protein [Candidatus Brocadiia bacterium]